MKQSKLKLLLWQGIIKDMRSIDSFFIFILFILLAVPSVIYFVEKDPFTQTASVSDAVNIEDLKNRYDRFSNGRNHVSNRIKVLIVPGHDDVHNGALFNGLREVDLNWRKIFINFCW